MTPEDGQGRARSVLLRTIAAASLLLCHSGNAASPDRTTIPLSTTSVASVFSRPISPDRPSVLAPFDFEDLSTAPGIVPAGSYPVSRITLAGSTALDPALVRPVLADYENRTLTFTEMIALRDRLTAMYVENGYLTSGVVLASLDDGVLTLLAVEGRLTAIRVSDDGHFRPRFVSRYLQGFGDPEPVNVYDLEERLQIFQQQPHVQVVDAALLPGENRGDSVLWVDPVETDRWAFGLEASNQLSPAIGSVQGVANVETLNLTGRADDLRLGARGAEGLLEFMGEYDFPIGTSGRRLSVYAFGADSDIVRGPYRDLDIGADSFTTGARFRQPLQRSLQQQTNLLATAEWRRSRTYLLGQGFSFVEGPEEGEATMAILRGGIETLRRTARDVIYARAELSAGLDALGATINSGADVPDGRFVKLRAQVQWARRLPWLDSQALFRVDGQLSDDPLFGLEQYPIGGRWTVRGYRENTLIRDNAILASLEWRLPLQQTVSGRHQLELRPFVDYAYSGNVDGDEIGPKTLASAGIGIYWSPVETLQLEVYWGEALKDVQYPDEYDIQDDGIHFRFNWMTSR